MNLPHSTTRLWSVMPRYFGWHICVHTLISRSAESCRCLRAQFKLIYGRHNGVFGTRKWFWVGHFPGIGPLLNEIRGIFNTTNLIQNIGQTWVRQTRHVRLVSKLGFHVASQSAQVGVRSVTGTLQKYRTHSFKTNINMSPPLVQGSLKLRTHLGYLRPTKMNQKEQNKQVSRGDGLQIPMMINFNDIYTNFYHLHNFYYFIFLNFLK